MSTIKVDTLQTTGGAGLYPARAWVNFNGTGTIAIRASGNVSSLTDSGFAYATVNFASALTDANICPSGMAKFDSTNANNGVPYVGIRRITSNPSSTYVRVSTNYSNSLDWECESVTVNITR